MDQVANAKTLSRQYVDAVDWLDRNYSYFLTHVLKIGRPKSTTSIPTAAVGPLLKDGEYDIDDFEFLFNPEFAQPLDTKSMAFIVSHEAMHILLNHLRLQRNLIDWDAYEKLRKNREGFLKGKLSKDELKDGLRAMRDMTYFNVAADCVINDYLYECGMEETTGFPLCRGEEVIGKNAAFMTVTEVYDTLKKQSESGADKGDDESDQEGDADGEGQGQGGGTYIDADGNKGTYKPLDQHDWIPSDDDIDKLVDALDKLKEEVEKEVGLPQDLVDKIDEDQGKNTAGQDANQQAMKPGDRDSNMEAFAQQHGVNLAWARLLNDVDPDMFKEPGIAPPMIPSFHRRPRKLGGKDFRKVHLPVYRKEERREKLTHEIPSIVLALDVSGSIGPKDADYFVSLAMTIPRERIKVFACTFQTKYQKIDLDNPRFTKGGGTSFDAVANFIENEVKPELKDKYPKAVVVITDGEADMRRDLWPEEEYYDNWLWLISPHDRSGYATCIREFGEKKMLSEYIV